MKPKRLNVREHLKHIQKVLDLRDEFGDCPLINDAFKEISLINRSILANHEDSRKAGNRKDIRVEK